MSNSAAPVSVFNANTQGVNVNINNAPSSFSINGTTPALSFFPTMPTAAAAPTFGSQPAANVLAPGANSVELTPQGATDPTIFTVQIPGNQQIQSLQLYVFWDTASTVGYMLLNNGQLIASDYQPYGSPS